MSIIVSQLLKGRHSFALASQVLFVILFGFFLWTLLSLGSMRVQDGNRVIEDIELQDS
jgi:hypothetical protein